jgi:hypothetical protein
MRQRFFRSTDAGRSWRELSIAWPDDAPQLEVNQMVVVDTD